MLRMSDGQSVLYFPQYMPGMLYQYVQFVIFDRDNVTIHEGDDNKHFSEAPASPTNQRRWVSPSYRGRDMA